jgi:hypothetical protein
MRKEDQQYVHVSIVGGVIGGDDITSWGRDIGLHPTVGGGASGGEG